MLFIYKNKDRYITVKGLKIGSTKNPENSAWWTTKRSAKTWETSIKSKYPQAELKEATLLEINPNVFK